MDYIPSRRSTFGRERAEVPRRRFDLTRTLPGDVGLGWPMQEALDPLLTEVAADYIPDPFGPLAARQAIAEFLGNLGCPCSADDLVVASGTSELFARILEALTDPGDEILVPEPGYPLLELIARSLGIVLVPYRLASFGGFHVDGDEIRRRITGRTRAIVVTSPHNPTGMCLTQDDISMLASIGLPVIADEVFRGYDLRNEVHPSATALRDSLPVAVLGGLSKGALLPGMKVSWALVAEPRGVRFRETVGLLCDTYLSASSPSLAAIPTWLNKAAPKRQALLNRCRRNLAALEQAATNCPSLTIPRPSGGWSALVRLPAIRTEDEWVTTFFDVDVNVQPGWLFDMDGGPWVVLSLITEESTFDEGIARICSAVSTAIA